MGIGNPFEVLLLLLAGFFTVISCVRITNLRVPDYFALEEGNTDYVVLDCEYEVESGESNLVVKWSKNDVMIYQWIHGSRPSAFPHMKGKINDSFEASKEDLHRYRALVLLDPSTNTTGDYKCSVQTTQSVDFKSRRLRVLDLRNITFEISQRTVENDDTEVTCEIRNVFPRPELSFILNDENEIRERPKNDMPNENGYYDLAITTTFDSNTIDDEAGKIECKLGFPLTNYTLMRSIQFSDSNSTAKTFRRNENILLSLTMISILISYYCKNVVLI